MKAIITINLHTSNKRTLCSLEINNKYFKTSFPHVTTKVPARLELGIYGSQARQFFFLSFIDIQHYKQINYLKWLCPINIGIYTRWLKLIKVLNYWKPGSFGVSFYAYCVVKTENLSVSLSLSLSVCLSVCLSLFLSLSCF